MKNSQLITCVGLLCIVAGCNPEAETTSTSTISTSTCDDVWYIDYDADGYGSDLYTATGCEAPTGYTDNSEDCDDSNASVYPNADEYCDDLDNDCDEEIDEDALDAMTLFEDADGDGYGDPDALVISCEEMSGYTEDDTDCDDIDAEVNPDAVEICYDGIDNNCDDSQTPCSLMTDSADGEIGGAADADTFGGALAYTGDLTGDGIDDLVVGAAYADLTADAPDAGATYLFAGPVDAKTVNATDATMVFMGVVTSDYAGTAIDGGSDLNGDGAIDLVIASQLDDQGGIADAGAAYIFFGPITGTGTESISTADVRIDMVKTWDRVTKLATGGDANGDGFQDLLIGSSYADGGGTSSGAIFLFEGPITDSMTADDAAMEMTGADENDLAARAIFVGDMDGDGDDEIVVGVPERSDNGDNSGTVYLVEGGSSADMSLADADLILTGEAATDQAGKTIAAAGDNNGDGYDDFLVAATHADPTSINEGSVYLVTGPLTYGSYADLSVATAKFNGAESKSRLGHAIASNQDIDGDGTSDIALSAPYGDKTNDSVVFMFVGAQEGTISAADADAQIYTSSEDAVGETLAFVGDIFDSGDTTLVVGAPDSMGSTGAIYLFNLSAD